jgi:hypothetical protein
MDPIDREILTLRHFEELSNAETAEVREISKTAASNRCVRALKRLKDALAGISGSLESGSSGPWPCCGEDEVCPGATPGSTPSAIRSNGRPRSSSNVSGGGSIRR